MPVLGVVHPQALADDRRVMGVQTLLLPVGAIVLLWAAGLGAADLLASRMPPDARAAIAAPLAAAILACMSPLALLHVHPGILACSVLVALMTLSVARKASVLEAARMATWPLAIGLFALAISAAPALRHGTWVATSFGNADPYVWTSQAKSLGEGPPPRPAASFPDRVSYDLLTNDHWPTGLPVALGAVADLGRLDPAEAYEAFAAVIAALVALAVFAGARGSLSWDARLSALAGVVVGANGLILLSTYFGWQAQLLLTVFGTLGVLTIPVCMDRRARAREAALPALFMAGGIATYGWVFATFVAVGCAVGTACWLQNPRSSVGRRRIAIRLGAVGGLTLAFGLVPTIQAVWSYATGGSRFDASVLRSWSQYDWGYPSDALGLVVRVGAQRSPGAGWTAFAVALASIFLGIGCVRVRSPRNPRGYVLASAAAVLVAELAVLALAHASPYTSLKLMGYSAPLLTLLALSTFVRRAPSGARPGGAAALVHVTGVLLSTTAAAAFAITTVFTVAYAVKWVRPATVVGGVVAAAERLPRGQGIRIDYRDAWRQSWLVYYLRDRRLAVSRPSVYLTGFSGARGPDRRSFASPASYALAPRHRGGAVWRGPGGVIYQIVPPATVQTSRR
jgi:hypothetical protein